MGVADDGGAAAGASGRGQDTAPLVLLTILTIALFERSLALLFSLGLVTLGLNASIWLSLALLSGFVYPLGLARLWPHPPRFVASWLLLLFDGSTALGPLWLLGCQASGLLVVARTIDPGRVAAPAAVGLQLGLAQLMALVSIVLFGTARVWPFMPEPLWPVLAGREMWGLAVGGALFLLFSLGTPLGEAPSPPAGRRAPLAAIVLAALVATGWLAWGGSSLEPLNDAPREIALLTYNVQLFLAEEPVGAFNLEPLAELLERYPADVIALQETDTATILGGHQIGAYWLARRLGMRYHYGPPTVEATPGVALLTRLDLAEARYERLPATTSVARGVVHARLVAPGGELEVVVVHIQWTRPGLPGSQTSEWETDQIAQTVRVLELVEGRDRVVILGDVNAGPEHPGPAYDLLRASYADAWVEAGNAVADPRGWTSTAKFPEKRIDHVFLSPSTWKVLPGSATVHGSAAISDHLAVRVLAQPR